MIATHQATRYVVPLREGGSLPAVVDTEGGGLFVTKFRGSGQGARALLAELLVAQIAEVAGLSVPETTLIELDDSFARSVRDQEIRDILAGSVGLNVGARYLEGALNFDPVADEVDPALAARIVWLDAFTSNIDRSARNPNLLWWQGEVRLIDHGAALYFHHDWESLSLERTRSAFTAISGHVLLPSAGDLIVADAEIGRLLTPERLREIVASLPDELLMDAPGGSAPPFDSPAANRGAYLDYLTARLDAPRAFLEGAITARQQARQAPAERKGYRR